MKPLSRAGKSGGIVKGFWYLEDMVLGKRKTWCDVCAFVALWLCREVVGEKVHRPEVEVTYNATANSQTPFGLWLAS